MKPPGSFERVPEECILKLIVPFLVEHGISPISFEALFLSRDRCKPGCAHGMHKCRGCLGRWDDAWKVGNRRPTLGAGEVVLQEPASGHGSNNLGLLWCLEVLYN